ncbi:uncharacterized protein [Nicotiana tomentosiformis]|uniref:uncharacterized protein n=1 Tax=Nicotiana tomentosiformis TaxID=4098 RepID=UPI00388CB787
MWVKGLPFKILFFMWKVWKAKFPLDDYLKNMGYLMPSRCWCCAQPTEETLAHLFLSSVAVKKVWSYFLMNASINLEGMTMHQTIVKCWTLKIYTNTQVLWELPPQGWIKVNSDGASRGNLGRSSIGFALRDDEGKIRFSCGKVIHVTTNNEAEALSIMEALKYCEDKGFKQIIL